MKGEYHGELSTPDDPLMQKRRGSDFGEVRRVREEFFTLPDGSQGVTLDVRPVTLKGYGFVVRLETDWFDKVFWEDVSQLQRKYNRRNKIASFVLDIYYKIFFWRRRK